MENPCLKCENVAEPARGHLYKAYEQCACVGQIPENIENTTFACGPYARYLGYQEGLAEKLESLKKSGIFVKAEGSMFVYRDDKGFCDAGYSLQQKHLGETGWLIFIREE